MNGPTALDLFCGAGGSSTGMAAAGVRVVMAANHWQLAVDVHQANHPKADHDCADISAVDPRRYPATDILWASPECFPANTLILARRGLVSIEEIRVGDEVLTHKRRWRAVTSVMERIADTVIVAGAGHARMEVTARHPFYARRNGKVWINDIRRYRRHPAEPEWIAAGDLAETDTAWSSFTDYGEPLPVPPVGGRGARMDSDFWWVVGRWLGDGSVRIEHNPPEPLPSVPRRRSQPAGSGCVVCGNPAEPDGRSATGHVSPYCSGRCKAANKRRNPIRVSRGEVHICCGNHETEDLGKRLATLEPDSGRRAASTTMRWQCRELRTGHLFTTGHLGLAEWLVAHFGRYSYGKTIPTWALTMPDHHRQALLNGYLSADGSLGRVTTAASVSKQVAVGVRLLALSLGHNASLRQPSKRRTGAIEGRQVSIRPLWSVGWTTDPNASHARTTEDGGIRWSPVREVRAGRKQVRVYNLSVADDESYVADGLIVHNCTNHSVAKGMRRVTGQGVLFGDEPDPGAERSRATMWDVPRFAEAMLMRGRPYEYIVVENVVDAALWMYWDAWLAAMHAAGYDHHVVYLNSAFAHGRDYGWYGAPQYRDRIYVVFWRRGAPAPDLDIRPPAWCPKCERHVDAMQAWKKPHERWGRYRAQYVYQCPDTSCRAEVEPLALLAAVAIDWSDLGARIGDRARPLAAATRERIRAGLARYGRPLMTPAGGTWNDAAQPVDVPMRARTTRETEGVTCPPLMIPVEGRAKASAVRPATGPTRTLTSSNDTALAVPQPFLALLRSGRPRTVGIGEPLATVVADGSNHALTAPDPFVAMLRNHVAPTAAGEPLATLTAAGNHHALTVPDGALLVPYYGTGVARPVSEPAGTVTTRDPADVGNDEIDDCTFRMLTPAEIGLAMAFPPDYAMSGPKRDRVRMYGNAVTPPAARLVVERLLAARGSAG